MVLGAWIRQRAQERGHERGLKEGREAGRKEGRKEGREAGMNEQQQRWLQWLDRRRQAEAKGLPFNEPPPGLDEERLTQELDDERE